MCRLPKRDFVVIFLLSPFIFSNKLHSKKNYYYDTYYDHLKIERWHSPGFNRVQMVWQGLPGISVATHEPPGCQCFARESESGVWLCRWWVHWPANRPELDPPYLRLTIFLSRNSEAIYSVPARWVTVLSEKSTGDPDLVTWGLAGGPRSNEETNLDMLNLRSRNSENVDSNLKIIMLRN